MQFIQQNVFQTPIYRKFKRLATGLIGSWLAAVAMNTTAMAQEITPPQPPSPPSSSQPTSSQPALPPGFSTSIENPPPTDAPLVSGTQAPSSRADEVIFRALAQVGVRYKFGGNHPDTGFDCSGLVGFAFREALGKNLPRSANEIWQHGASAERDSLQPGDLVFFNTLRRPYSHVGIYLGDGRFVHAPSSGGVVRIESMEGRYWVSRYNGAKRIL
jgi:cell wall-associated NlpC family hydrolase